jgi:hypothetical protein
MQTDYRSGEKNVVWDYFKEVSFQNLGTVAASTRTTTKSRRKRTGVWTPVPVLSIPGTERRWFYVHRAVEDYDVDHRD